MHFEAYTRRDNLIITGLPVRSAAEAASIPDGDGRGEHGATTQQAVLELCNQHLNVPITPADISITHRLKKQPTAKGPPAVIVRFTNRIARDTVYAAPL
jgi:hypothetical protein